MAPFGIRCNTASRYTSLPASRKAPTPNGAVEWMCAPRMDSPSVFAAMLDRGAGAFRLSAAEAEGVESAGRQVGRAGVAHRVADGRAHMVVERLVVPPGLRHADDRYAEPAALSHLVERREQLLAGQVAGDAEHDTDAQRGGPRGAPVTAVRAERSGETLRMDESTRRNLELTETLRGEPAPTLFSLLDECATGMGSRLLRHWLHHPLRDRAALEQRHEAVEALDASAAALHAALWRLASLSTFFIT